MSNLDYLRQQAIRQWTQEYLSPKMDAIAADTPQSRAKRQEREADAAMLDEFRAKHTPVQEQA